MFFGVGGTGKSWLLKRLRNALAEQLSIPWAYIDFDRQSGGPSYVSDFSNLLAEVWRQFDVECPRFEAAYSWMRFKQGAADRPLIRHSGEVSAGWDLVKEVASVGLKDVPGGNLLAWLGHKIGKALSERFEKTALAKRLLSQAGHDDYVRLSRLTAQRSTRRLPNGLAKTSTSSSRSAPESGVAASYSSTRLRILPVANRTMLAGKLSRSRSATSTRI